MDRSLKMANGDLIPYPIEFKETEELVSIGVIGKAKLYNSYVVTHTKYGPCMIGVLCDLPSEGDYIILQNGSYNWEPEEWVSDYFSWIYNESPWANCTPEIIQALEDKEAFLSRGVITMKYETFRNLSVDSFWNFSVACRMAYERPYEMKEFVEGMRNGLDPKLLYCALYFVCSLRNVFGDFYNSYLQFGENPYDKGHFPLNKNNFKGFLNETFHVSRSFDPISSRKYSDWPNKIWSENQFITLPVHMHDKPLTQESLKEVYDFVKEILT